MSQGGEALSGPQDADLDLPPDAFLKTLGPAERVLVELKGKLYEGSWGRILEDLEARLNGLPYIYKLSQRLEQDIAAVKRLRAYEERHGVDLAKLLAV